MIFISWLVHSTNKTIDHDVEEAANNLILKIPTIPFSIDGW